MLGLAQTLNNDYIYFSQIEDSLRYYQNWAFNSKYFKNKVWGNQKFLEKWGAILKNENSFYYPFDSIKKDSKISILTSPDKSFRVITWDFRNEDETHVYYGFIQNFNNNLVVTNSQINRKQKQKGVYQLFELTDKSHVIQNPEQYKNDHQKWYGMLYFGVIVKMNKTSFLLTGWDGNNKTSQKKFIDVLSFKSDGTPIFGKDVFQFPTKKIIQRAVFEYATDVTMSLKYFKDKNTFVLDHLAPSAQNSLLDGQYQFYGPDGSYDAFKLIDNKLVYEKDVKQLNTTVNKKSKYSNIYNKPK